MESSINYLQGRFLELLSNKIWIKLFPLDNWDSWMYEVFAEDCMSPFFSAYKCKTEFSSYELALDNAIEYCNKEFELPTTTNH